jgi:hypothetical protein
MKKGGVGLIVLNVGKVLYFLPYDINVLGMCVHRGAH